ncbi:MAG: Bug family tripartite tricarboxylate transporter substrate binding protein [Betaproteobacteria bacterium]
MKRPILALLAALAPGIAAAQLYPSKTVTLVNPFTAGGPIDLLARAVGQKLNEAWGQPVIVETRSGAAGNIGIEFVAKAPADGYTLLVMPTGNAVVNPHLFAKLPYDTFRDFAPVALLATVENMLVVHPSVKASSVQELIALAKANPGKLSFSSGGVGTQAHIAGEMLKSIAGVEMLHVPYKGMAPAMNDLLGGQVSFMVLSMSSALKHVQAGKLRALGVASLKRSSAAPDLPTVAEQGLPGFEAVSWYALMAPAGTPPDVIEKIAGECARALRAPDVRERLRGLGADPVGNTPAELGAMLKREYAFWGDFIRKQGIRGE